MFVLEQNSDKTHYKEIPWNAYCHRLKNQSEKSGWIIKIGVQSYQVMKLQLNFNLSHARETLGNESSAVS